VLLGLEGETSGELPSGCERHPYRLGARRRAVILQRV
jgi:hypothetical protein